METTLYVDGIEVLVSISEDNGGHEPMVMHMCHEELTTKQLDEVKELARQYYKNNKGKIMKKVGFIVLLNTDNPVFRGIAKDLKNNVLNIIDNPDFEHNYDKNSAITKYIQPKHIYVLDEEIPAVKNDWAYNGERLIHLNNSKALSMMEIDLQSGGKYFKVIGTTNDSLTWRYDTIGKNKQKGRSLTGVAFIHPDFIKVLAEAYNDANNPCYSDDIPMMKVNVDMFALTKSNDKYSNLVPLIDKDNYINVSLVEDLITRQSKGRINRENSNVEVINLVEDKSNNVGTTEGVDKGASVHLKGHMTHRGGSGENF